MWVIKLGGSLAAAERLPQLLRCLAAAGSGRCVLVPGGGPFADAVRVAQRQWRFDDARAHHMALLAMVQYGLLLTGLNPALQAAPDPATIRAALAAGRLPVWTGVTAALADPGLEASWQLTSDSLAVWLARRLNAAGALLAKTVPPPAATLSDLAAARYIDPQCPAQAERFARPVVCVDSEFLCDARRLNNLLAGDVVAAGFTQRG